MQLTVMQAFRLKVDTCVSCMAAMIFWAYPCGPGYPFIRLQALRAGPVSTSIPHAGEVRPVFKGSRKRPSCSTRDECPRKMDL